MSTRKVKKGEPWRPDSAADHNAKARAADAYRRGLPFTPDRAHPIDPCRIWVKNSSGTAREMFECLELDDAIILNQVTAEQIYVDGIEPTDTGIPFAVLLQPAAIDGWRRGQVAGICPALVDVLDADHTRAYLAAGEYVLTSSNTGPVAIVQKPDSTGEQLCVILFQAESTNQVRRCCLAENHPGCGVVFDLKLGTWNPATDAWDYEATASAHGIDFFYAVDFTYPNAGATGNFEPRPSDTYGTLWVALGNVSCDDDACGGCGGE